MANLAQMKRELKAERNHMAKEIQRLDEAISAVGKLLVSNSVLGRKKRSRIRRLSAAARKRIADAQRARWAKLKKLKSA